VLPRRAKVVILIVAIAVTVLLAVIAVWGLFRENEYINPYGNEVVAIKDLEQNTVGLTDNLKVGMMNSLYRIVALNIPEGESMPETIDDAAIRPGSEKMTEPNKKSIYTKSFIVDIPSIKQTYRAFYEYSSNREVVSQMANIVVTVSCPNDDDLIYEKFACKEIAYQGEPNQDPVIKILPRSTITYEIRAISNPDQTVSLSVTLFPSASDYRSGVSTAVERYKAQALSWLESKDIDPSKYTIKYIY